MVDGVAYTPIHFAAFVLQQLRRDAEAYLQFSVSKAVIAAPAYFDQSQFAALIQAARLAWLDVVRVLPEPVAACIGVRADSNDDKSWLVYDLGGGTFDASVVEFGDQVFEVKAVNGNTRLGGADFDRILVDYCVQEFRKTTGVDLGGDAPALMRIRDAAERAKIALSRTQTSSVRVPFVASANGAPLHLDVRLTQRCCNELTNELVAETVRLSREALEDAGYSPGTIDNVLVVGRAARASSVSVALGDLFGPRLRMAPDPIVALGAAMQGGVLSGEHRDILLLEAITHTLRVQLAGGRTTPVVVRNTTVPTRRTLALSPQRAGLRRLLVRILAGDSSWADENLLLAEIEVTCTRGIGFPLSLHLDIDANHVLQVEIQSVGGAKLAARRFDLRRDGGSFRAGGNQVPHLDDLLMPSWPKCVQIAHIAGQMGNDASTVQRWICRTATDLVLELVGPGARGGWWKDLDAWLLAHPAKEIPLEFSRAVVFDIFSEERELLVDALEQYFGEALGYLRR